MKTKYYTEGDTQEQLCINFLKQIDPILNEIMPMDVTYDEEREVYANRIYCLRKLSKQVAADIKALLYDRLELEKEYSKDE